MVVVPLPPASTKTFFFLKVLVIFRASLCPPFAPTSTAASARIACKTRGRSKFICALALLSTPNSLLFRRRAFILAASRGFLGVDLVIGIRLNPLLPAPEAPPPNLGVPPVLLNRPPRSAAAPAMITPLIARVKAPEKSLNNF